MKHKINVRGYELEIEQDSDGKFIIPETFRGIGTALKPASEHWILCRKPLSEKTVADNVLKWGTGGINIDISRIGTEGGKGLVIDTLEKQTPDKDWNTRNVVEDDTIRGRFPANFIHDGSDEVMEEFDKAGKSKTRPMIIKGHTSNGEVGKEFDSTRKNDWESNRSDEGSAARFFYCSKPSGKEKNEGLDDFEDKKLCQGGYGTEWHSEKQNDIGLNKIKISKNNHPTIKSVKLMTYLINMITPPNGIVLDPFMGSGTTGVAAVKSDYNFIGIEKEEEYYTISKARIDYSKNKMSE